MQDDDAITACEQLITTWPTPWIDSAVKAQVMRTNHVGGYTVFNGLTPQDLANFVMPIIQRAILDERERCLCICRREDPEGFATHLIETGDDVALRPNVEANRRGTD